MSKRFAVSLLAIIIACFLSFIFLNRIIAFSVSAFSDLSVTFTKSKGNIVGGTEIEGLKALTKNKKLDISADKAFIRVLAGQSLKEKKIIMVCRMESVKLDAKMESTEGGSAADNVMAMPFSSDQKYKELRFTVALDGKATSIKGFKADSDDIRMAGDCVFYRGKDDISLDFKISFSPQISATFPEDVRNGVLSPDEGGWYSTVISYRGNMLMLMALYSLTMPA